jgi:hypothetical protein
VKFTLPLIQNLLCHCAGFLLKGGLLGLGRVMKGTLQMGNLVYAYKYADKYIKFSPLGLLWLDLKIIGRGLKVIVQGKGL